MVSADVGRVSRSRLHGRLATVGVAYIALTYFLWTPFDVAVRGIGSPGRVIAVAIAAYALSAFALYLVFTRPVSATDRSVTLLVLWLAVAFLLSIALRGGILGAREFTGNYVFRMLIVVSALAVGLRVGEAGALVPKVAKKVGLLIVVTLLSMMVLALVRGVYAEIYVGQGVRAVGTPGGAPVQAYLLAFSVPLLLLVRSAGWRNALVALTVVAVALTYRRGPLLCAIVPIAVMPFVDRHRSSGRRWYFDMSLLGVVAVSVVSVIGSDALFGRWEALARGDAWALSERDVIYPVLLSEVFPPSWSIVFGQGVGAPAEVLGAVLGREIFAHNDWLELLVSVGLFGTLPYLLIHYVAVREVSAGLRADRYVGVAAVGLYLQFLLAGWIEGTLYAAQHGAYLTFFLGTSIGWCRRVRHGS